MRTDALGVALATVLGVRERRGSDLRYPSQVREKTEDGFTVRCCEGEEMKSENEFCRETQSCNRS